MSIFSYTERRSRGLRYDTTSVYHSVYSGITKWLTATSGNNNIGGIYNLEFSPNGSILVAACEKKSVQLFDTVARKQYSHIPDAHSDCVNCVKFLDDRIFATCSDDCSVRIWDIRNLKARVRKLTGHKSWVKNIEYSRKDNLLVTSGLDGSIYMWDLDESRHQKIFHTPGLMRCRISNDDNKMVICTTGGYLLIVNDLNLTTLASDLKGFRPNIHRLMQMGDQFFPIVSEFKHVFDKRRKRNRVELISDFPENNEAEVICSLAIHPHNWCCVSRNMNADEQSEWTCVHDIQEMADRSQQGNSNSGSSSSGSSSRSRDPPPPSPNEQEDEYDLTKLEIAQQFAELRQLVLDQMQGASEATRNRAKIYLKKVNRFLTLLGHLATKVSLPLAPNTSSFDIWSGQTMNSQSAGRSSSGISRLRSGLIVGEVMQDLDEQENSRAESDGRYFLSSSDESGDEDENDDDDEDEDDAIGVDERADEEETSEETTTASTSMTVDKQTPPRTRAEVEKFYAFIGQRLSQLIDQLHDAQKLMNQKYKTNKKRLLYYSQELNSGKGFIKELCFSADGRVIASPYGNGLRVLAFNPKCQELSECVTSWSDPQPPRALHEVVVEKNSHSNVVVCAKFSPTFPMLVTGCLKGSIVWHYPRL